MSLTTQICNYRKTCENGAGQLRRRRAPRNEMQLGSLRHASLIEGPSEQE